jgi:putative membrane protein
MDQSSVKAMKYMKQIVILAATAFIISCNDANRTASDNADSTTNNIATAPVENANNDTTASSGHQPDASTTGTAIDKTPLDKNSSEFATEAASGGMMEVTLGQMAQQKATNPRVQAFGAMMVSDHSKANTELKNIADAKSFQLPSTLEKHQKHIDDISKKEGKEFDKAYIKMMVDDHQKDIRAFEKAASGSSDSTIKGFASRTLPILRMHLDSAKAIHKSLK